MEEEEEEGGYVAEGRMLYHSTHHLSKSWEWGGVRLDAWTIVGDDGGGVGSLGSKKSF